MEGKGEREFISCVIVLRLYSVTQFLSVDASEVNARVPMCMRVSTYVCSKQQQMSNVNERDKEAQKRRQTNERTPVYILLCYQSEERK